MVAADSAGCEPRLLRAERHRTAQLRLTRCHLELAQQGRDQQRFPGADGSNHGDQFAIACAEIQIAQRNSPAGEAELAIEDDRPPAASAALLRAPVAR